MEGGVFTCFYSGIYIRLAWIRSFSILGIKLPGINVSLVSCDLVACILLQNAAPDGPVTWALKEATERPLRMMDDDFATAKTWGAPFTQADPPRLCLLIDVRKML